MKNNFMDFADIRVLHGKQGDGKTLACIAMMVEDYYENIIAIESADGKIIQARALNDTEKEELEEQGIDYSPLKHFCIISGNKTKIITLPFPTNQYKIISPIKIFSTIPLYGLKYVLFKGQMIIEHINSDFIRDAWVLFDESILARRDDTTTVEGKMGKNLYAQIAKRNVHLLVNAQFENQLQKQLLLHATTSIECTYDKETHYIELDVNKSSPVMNSTSFYAPAYWFFYDRSKITQTPQYKVDAIMKRINEASLVSM